jgi:hypothetical protein
MMMLQSRLMGDVDRAPARVVRLTDDPIATRHVAFHPDGVMRRLAASPRLE